MAYLATYGLGSLLAPSGPPSYPQGAQGAQGTPCDASCSVPCDASCSVPCSGFQGARSAEPLPAGHPISWSLLTSGTCLDGAAYERGVPLCNQVALPTHADAERQVALVGGIIAKHKAALERMAWGRAMQWTGS